MGVNAGAIQVLLKSPMLLESELEAITSQTGMMNKTFNLHYESGQPGALKAAVHALCKDVEEAVRNGCEVRLLQSSCWSCLNHRHIVNTFVCWSINLRLSWSWSKDRWPEKIKAVAKQIEFGPMQLPFAVCQSPGKYASFFSCSITSFTRRCCQPPRKRFLRLTGCHAAQT